MAMATVLKMELWDRSDGSARCMVTSVPCDPKKVMNPRDYAFKFRRHLAQLRAYDRFMIIIDSKGGAKASAIGLLEAMRREIGTKKQPAAVLIDGVCGSAATYLAAGLKKVPVYITPGSRYYIHLPRTSIFSRRGGGVWNVIYKAGDKSTTRDLIKMYHQKSSVPAGGIWKALGIKKKKHIPKRTIRKWLEAGTSFTAGEAVQYGFADGIMTRYEFEKGGAWSKC